MRGVGDLETFEDFLACRDARFVIATSMPWAETGDFFEKTLGIPSLYLPTSYSIDEIEEYNKRIREKIVQCVPEASSLQLGEVRTRIQRRRAEAKTAIDRLLNTRMAYNLELDVQLINRPFSLIEALENYGFNIAAFQPSPMRIQHKEADDAPAFERLSLSHPEIERRFKERPNRRERKGGTSTRRGHAPGRYVEFKRPEKVERVPEETAWWGYSSVLKLANEIGKGQQPGAGHPMRPGGASPAAERKWSL